MLEQKSCFAPKIEMFEQNSSFASKMFEEKSCFTHKMFEQMFPNISRWYHMKYTVHGYVRNPNMLVSYDVQYVDMLGIQVNTGNARLCIASLQVSMHAK